MTLLALPQPGPPRGCRRALARLGRLQLEHAAERHAEQAGAADAEDVAARDAEVAVAQILAGLARDAEHRHAEIPLWSKPRSAAALAVVWSRSVYTRGG